MYRKTAVNEYFQWLKDTVDSNSTLYKVVSEYLDTENEKREHEGPFLTVVTRTQGKRKHMLAETLLCLQGQSNLNFEVLIMAHNVESQQMVQVEEIVNDVPEWFREKIRIIPVCGGTRTTPLNKGFEEARGEYIAILDDDDIVFDNWVSSFYELAQTNNGKTLHTYAVDQEWEVVGEDGIPRACGAPESDYCQMFDLKKQMNVNACPLHSLAFPADAFKEIGIKFDEFLNTTEDWDFLMRTILFTGVADKREITCIYRRWFNAENSQTIHNEEEWDINYKYVSDRLRSMPMVVLPNSYDVIFGPRSKYNKHICIEENELFYDTGNGLSSTCKLKCYEADKETGYLVEFVFEEDIKEVCAIRIDPMEKGGFALDNLKIKVETASGNEHIYRIEDVTHNGMQLANGTIVYLKDDPQIAISFEKAEKINKVYVKYDLITPLNEEILDQMFDKRSTKRRVADAILRRIRNVCARIVKVFK